MKEKEDLKKFIEEKTEAENCKYRNKDLRSKSAYEQGILKPPQCNTNHDRIEERESRSRRHRERYDYQLL